MALIRYSQHLLLRIQMRGIPKDLPRIVYKSAKQRFFDIETNLEVVVGEAKFAGKKRSFAVIYRIQKEEVLFITIHPLKIHQLENRIKTGRWRILP